MSKDKHPSICSCQMEAIVCIILQIFFMLSFENWGIPLDFPQFLADTTWIANFVNYSKNLYYISPFLP